MIQTPRAGVYVPARSRSPLRESEARVGSRIIPKKHRNKGYLQPENYTSIIGVCCLKSGQCAGLRVFAAWAKAATSSAAYLAAGAVKEESWPTISLGSHR